MPSPLRLHDRRGPNRPCNGDTAPCPQCATGTMEFNERYRVTLSNGKVAVIAAWICDRPDCKYGRPVREEQGAQNIISTSLAQKKKKKN